MPFLLTSENKTSNLFLTARCSLLFLFPEWVSACIQHIVSYLSVERFRYSSRWNIVHCWTTHGPVSTNVLKTNKLDLRVNSGVVKAGTWNSCKFAMNSCSDVRYKRWFHVWTWILCKFISDLCSNENKIFSRNYKSRVKGS